MMSSNKAQDGYSKLLTKADCERLKSKTLKKEVEQCEQLVCKFFLLHYLQQKKFVRFVLLPLHLQADLVRLMGANAKFQIRRGYPSESLW